MPASCDVDPMHPADPDQACEFHDNALDMQAQGHYAQALDHARHALALMERAVGLAHPDVANLLNTASALAITQDAYDEA